MDSVRFGRALGFGARSAAKAIAGAVDAATAPNPSAPKPSVRSAQPRPQAVQQSSPLLTAETGARAADTGPIASAAKAAAHATIRARNTRKGLARGGKRFGEAIWGPFVKLSGVLWLEITGAFFGIFALFAGQAAWIHRLDLRPYANHADPDHAARNHAIALIAMTFVFGYFCLSSFFRAHRRQRSK